MTDTKNTPHTPESRSSRNVKKSTGSGASREPRRETGDHQANGHRPSPIEVLRKARAQLTELIGMSAESVSSFEQSEDGWLLEVEVLELARVPDTMSLLASYQVELDPQGELTGYRRIRRYERGRSDAHRPGGR